MHHFLIREPLDVYIGISARKYLRKYFEMTEIPRQDYIATLWPTASSSDVKFFQGIESLSSPLLALSSPPLYSALLTLSSPL